MNLLASGGFQGFVNAIFDNWQMILFVVLAVLLLLTIIFRHFKITAFILTVIVVAIGVILVVNLITEALTWELVDLVSFLVRWVPTVIFTVTVLLATILGILRGLRKSLILLVQEVAAAVVCIVAYVILVRSAKTDAFMLNAVNFFMGGSGSLENALNVTAPCEGLRDVMVEWLPTFFNGDLGVMLGESKAYIYTLADLIYHIGFALILYIVFLVIDFILYIIYHCFYSERKYKTKIDEKYTQNKVDRRYSKHSVGGGVVGAVRGVTIGLLSLSFMGTVLFAVAGRGEGKLKEYDFGNEDVNTYYSVYRSVESYGNYGIFKVLNAVSSPEEAPYYLFAADLVFSGELNDEELGVSGNIVFREELAAYTGFARDTMDLVMKYGGDKIKPLVSGGADKASFDTVLEIMSDDGFKAEFRDLIGEFDAQTYIFNFAMSFINTAIANIDDMSFASSVSADNRELLKILFTKGYLSDTIPDEKALKKEGQEVVRPYLNVAKFVTKEDVQILYGVVIDVLTGNANGADEVINLVADVIPQIKSVSLLSEDRAEELDPVLGRLYCYAANRYLTEEGSEGVTYDSIYKDDIEWVGEINMLLDVTDAAFGLYKNVYYSGVKPYDAMLSIFDKNDPNYKTNCEYYDAICGSIIKSRILGKAMSTSFVYNTLEKALSGVLEGIYIPKDTVYESTFDADGKLVSAGEVYNLFNGVSLLGKNSDILSLLNGFGEDKDMKKLLNSLSDVLKVTDENGKKACDYLVESNLLRAVLSAAIINYGGDFVYVPQIARDTDGDGNKVNLITKEELATLFDSLPELVEFVTPIMNGDGNSNAAIADFVKKDTFKTLLNSSAIFEGTAAKLLVDAMGENDTVVIPAALKGDYESWVSQKSKRGELKNLLDAIDIVGVDIADAVNGALNADAVLDNVLALTDAQLDGCFKSSVLHYTISKFLLDDNLDFGSFKLIVPAASKNLLEEDSLPAVVKKEELKRVVSLAQDFDLSEESDISSVFKKLVQHKSALEESYLLAASVTYSLVNSSDTAMLEIPEVLKNAATQERLEKFNSSNPWKVEIVRLVDALDEILNVSADSEFTFDEQKVEDGVYDLLKNINGVSTVNPKATKLAVCMGSEVVKSSITKELDEILEGNIDEEFIYGAKSGGYYSERELSSLSNALNIFGIDVKNMNADTLTNNVKEQLLSLNDYSEFEGRTKLNVIYPSMIISGMLSKELDNALLDKDNAESPSPMIDSDVLNSIKGGNSRYTEDEISKLIDSINAFGVDSFDNLNKLDFDDIRNKRDQLDVMCESYIVRGVFTKQIKENNELDVDHELAYERDIKVLKTDEIESMVDLVDAVCGDDPNANLDDIYFDQISLNTIRANLFKADGSIKSYLVHSAVSGCLKDNTHIFINRTLIDSYGCVERSELKNLIDGFAAIEGGDSNINDWSENGNFKYPDATARSVALRSEILRAKLTYQLIEENERTATGNREYYLTSGHYKQYTDYKSGTVKPLISGVELIALFNALDEHRSTDGSGNNFVIPVLNYATIRQKYDELGSDGGNAYVDRIFASDMLRFSVSGNSQIQLVATGLGIEPTEESAIKVDKNSFDSFTVKSFTAEQVKSVVQAVVI